MKTCESSGKKREAHKHTFDYYLFAFGLWLYRMLHTHLSCCLAHIISIFNLFCLDNCRLSVIFFLQINRHRSGHTAINIHYYLVVSFMCCWLHRRFSCAAANYKTKRRDKKKSMKQTTESSCDNIYFSSQFQLFGLWLYCDKQWFR